MDLELIECCEMFTLEVEVYSYNVHGLYLDFWVKGWSIAYGKQLFTPLLTLFLFFGHNFGAAGNINLPIMFMYV